MNRFPIIAILVSLLTAALTRPAQPATLVEKGQPRAVIVLPEKPTPVIEGAARLLRDHIKEMSGAELPIRTENLIRGDAGKDQVWILVGESKLIQKQGLTSKGLGAGGIVLVAKGNVLVLFGTDAKTLTDADGTRYAVTTFLEDKLGVRYLWPGEIGKVVPRKETIVVEDFEQHFVPRLAQRRIRNMPYHDRVQVGLNNLGFKKEDYVNTHAEAEQTKIKSPDWFAWQRLGGTLNMSGGHAFSGSWGKYGKDHPDWFALQANGSRDQSRQPDRARLCMSNPELIAAIAKEKIEELTRNPTMLGVALGPNDGGRSSFCTCPKCEALDSPKGRKVKLWDFTSGVRRDFDHVSLTDRTTYFWNAIAEQVVKVHPDKFLVVDSYSAYTAAPVERKLHPNLVVRFSPMSYGDDEYRKESMRDWDDWSKATKRIFFRPNLLLLGRREGLPQLYTHKFGEDFRYMANHGMMGTDFDACVHHWATQGLNYYVVARLQWNPEQSVDVIIDDYCRAGFGPAAPSIRRYFDQLEAVTNEAALKKVKAAEMITPKVLVSLREELVQAGKLAANDPTVTKRIAFLETGLRWTELEARSHAFRDPAKADKVVIKKALDERFVFMQEVFRKSPLALNVAYISWGEDANWSKLSWQRPVPARKP